MKHLSKEALIREHHPAAIQQRLSAGAKRQTISDAVLGGIDGCITTFAVVSGSLGAGFPSAVAVILGFANLLADGFSMAVSNYEASQAEKEFTEAVRQSEQRHIDEIPEGEREEIRQLYRAKGFDDELLEKIVATITADQRIWLDTMLLEEHGLGKITPNPSLSAGITFIAFVAAGAVPLLPYMVSSLATHQLFLASAMLAGTMFFFIGMLKSFMLAKPVLLSGLRTLLTGGAAATLAYVTAYVLREILNIAAS